MDGISGAGTPVSGRAAIKRAVRISSLVIDTVESVILAREAPQDNLLCGFATLAGELGDALESTGQSLPMELEFFRDITLGANNDGVSAFTFLGLPVRNEHEEWLYVDLGLAVCWFRLYRQFHDELRAASQVKTRRCRQGRAVGGRPKDPEVARFEGDVERFLAASLDHLERNGVDRKSASERIKGWSPGEIIRRMNEEFGRRYATRGLEWDALRKRVERLLAARDLQALSECGDEPEQEPLAAPKRDACWAMENGLHIQR
jgi:hypothetical protein